jgi:hypothetical protein
MANVIEGKQNVIYDRDFFFDDNLDINLNIFSNKLGLNKYVDALRAENKALKEEVNFKMAIHQF